MKTHSNRSTGQIKIKDIGIGNYVGIEINSNKRYL